MSLVSEVAVFTRFSNRVCFLSCCVSQSAFWICHTLPQWFLINWYSSFLPRCPRFADSIRGMLKLILVLMLAGASLSATWFTLTCLSRVTHLPSTAGESMAASLSRWHCIQAVQLRYNPEPKWIQWAVQGSFSDWSRTAHSELFYGFVEHQITGVFSMC